MLSRMVNLSIAIFLDRLYRPILPSSSVLMLPEFYLPELHFEALVLAKDTSSIDIFMELSIINTRLLR